LEIPFESAKSSHTTVRARKDGFNYCLPVSPVFEEDKIPKEIKNRHEAQSRPWIMKGELKPF
jgi:hypothetical protein